MLPTNRLLIAGLPGVQNSAPIDRFAVSTSLSAVPTMIGRLEVLLPASSPPMEWALTPARFPSV